MAVETKVAGAKSPISLLPWSFQDEGELSECFEWSTGLDGVGWLPWQGDDGRAVLHRGRRGATWSCIEEMECRGLIAEVTT